MQKLHDGGRARLGLVTVLAVAVGLVASAGASAAPGDNVRAARLCLRGGWQTFQTSTAQQFRGPVGCIIYALRGGTLVPIGGQVVPPVVPPTGGGQ
jgi:hypothetical protein